MLTPADEHLRSGCAPFQLGTQANLLDQAGDGAIGPEQVMIELLEPGAADLEAGGQATGQRLALEDGDTAASLREAQGYRQTGGPGTQDGVPSISGRPLRLGAISGQERSLPTAGRPARRSCPAG